MIVFYNVCNHCGTQTQIGGENKEEGNGFEFFYHVVDLKESIKNIKPFLQKSNSGTFCDRNCLIEFLKNNLEINGKVK